MMVAAVSALLIAFPMARTEYTEEEKLAIATVMEKTGPLSLYAKLALYAELTGVRFVDEKHEIRRG